MKTCVHSPTGYTGGDDARVGLLAMVMKQAGVDGVVLTSTWKHMQEDEEDYVTIIKYGVYNYGYER